MKLSRSDRAKLACLYAGVIWGIYWIPLRMMGDAGLGGVWATVLFYLVPLLLLLPLYAIRWRHIASGGTALHLGAGLAGIALVFYANALVYTEVIHALALYYLTPLWGFLFARLIIGEVITPVRWLSTVFGLLGLYVMFAHETGLPLPRNLGDWMGLAGGITWAAASTAMLVNNQVKWQDFGLAYFFWGTLAALALAMLPIEGASSIPDMEVIAGVLPWLVPVLLVAVIPGSFASIFGASVLNPGIVGLLFMAEISVGTVTAALWADEPFGTREIVGVLLISAAGLCEPLIGLAKRARRTAEQD